MKFFKSLWSTFLSGILLIFFYEWTFIDEYGLNGIIMGLVAGLIMSFLWGGLEWAFFPHTRNRKSGTEFDILPIKNKKYLLKMFLFNTLAFGILMGTIELVEHGIIGLIVGLLCGGVLFGSFMILNNKITVQKKLKKLGIKMFEGAMGVQHIRNMELNIPYDKAFELCLLSPGFIKKYNIINTEPLEGKIKVEVGKLYKNMILFDVKKIDKKRTQVKILTKPVENSILMDGGLNMENIEKITRFLKEQETA